MSLLTNDWLRYVETFFLKKLLRVLWVCLHQSGRPHSVARGVISWHIPYWIFWYSATFFSVKPLYVAGLVVCPMWRYYKSITSLSSPLPSSLRMAWSQISLLLLPFCLCWLREKQAVNMVHQWCFQLVASIFQHICFHLKAGVVIVCSHLYWQYPAQNIFLCFWSFRHITHSSFFTMAI